VRALALLFLSGCATLTAPYRQRDPLPLQVVYETQLQERFEREGIATDDEVRDRAQRNGTLNAAIFLADAEFARFEASLYVSSATLNTATDLAVLGATGAATALSSGGNLVATGVLTGLATALTGGRLAVQDAFFAQHGRIAVIATMRSLRANAAVVLARGMRKSLAAYPLSRGLIDVQAYINAGSVIGALQAIADRAVVRQVESEATLLDERRRDADDSARP